MYDPDDPGIAKQEAFEAEFCRLEDLPCSSSMQYHIKICIESLFKTGDVDALADSLDELESYIAQMPGNNRLEWHFAEFKLCKVEDNNSNDNLSKT